MEAIYHIQPDRLALIDFISMQDIYELSEHKYVILFNNSRLTL